MQPPDVAALIALVDRLQSDNRELAATAAVWQERARVLGEQLALAAPASHDAPESDQGARETADSPEPSTGAVRVERGA